MKSEKNLSRDEFEIMGKRSTAKFPLFLFLFLSHFWSPLHYLHWFCIGGWWKISFGSAIHMYSHILQCNDMVGTLYSLYVVLPSGVVHRMKLFDSHGISNIKSQCKWKSAKIALMPHARAWERTTRMNIVNQTNV